MTLAFLHWWTHRKFVKEQLGTKGALGEGLGDLDVSQTGLGKFITASDLVVGIAAARKLWWGAKKAATLTADPDPLELLSMLQQQLLEVEDSLEASAAYQQV